MNFYFQFFIIGIIISILHTSFCHTQLYALYACFTEKTETQRHHECCLQSRSKKVAEFLTLFSDLDLTLAFLYLELHFTIYVHFEDF